MSIAGYVLALSVFFVLFFVYLIAYSCRLVKREKKLNCQRMILEQMYELDMHLLEWVKNHPDCDLDDPEAQHILCALIHAEVRFAQTLTGEA